MNLVSILFFYLYSDLVLSFTSYAIPVLVYSNYILNFSDVTSKLLKWLNFSHNIQIFEKHFNQYWTDMLEDTQTEMM